MDKKQSIKLIRLVLAAIIALALGALKTESVPILIAAYLVPYLLAGYEVIYFAARNILNGQVFDEKFLMAIATVGAFVIGEYTEGVMVMVFFGVGELFEKLAVGKSRKSIAELMDILPESANLVRDGEIFEVSPDEISKGDVILVRPGERIPLDGVVTHGESFIDTSALTGEPLPKKAGVGDKVISGCVNGDGLIYVRVESEFYESTATKILELVESSTMKKARSEAFITKFARYYTPCVVIGAVLISLVAAIVTGQIFESVKRGLVFLVVSCPCALVISVPLSFFGGMGGASKKGILIKGSEFIEALSKTQIAVFDKTGTLTQGKFTLLEVYTEDVLPEEFLEYAACIESASNHPVAKCLKGAYRGEVNISELRDVTELRGGGVSGIYRGRRVLLGNRRLMEENGVIITRTPKKAGNGVYMALDGVFAGYALLGDAEKTGAREAINALKSLGVEKSVMLTGDVDAVAREVASSLGVDSVYSELLPADKVSVCEELLRTKTKKKTLVYAGDGINDAPVLSRADVGIAMGAMGSDAAIEAADVVLMDDDPRKIAEAIRISVKTVRIVRQNIVFALSVKGLVLVLGALGFANMWLAVFADVGVSVIAILNSMRTLGKRRS